MAPAATAASPVVPTPVSLKAAMNGPTDSADDSTATTQASFDASTLFAADKAVRDSAVQTFVAQAQSDGPAALTASGYADALKKAIVDKKSPAVREAACASVLALTQNEAAIKALEPSFVDSGILAALLEALADKIPGVRTAAQAVLIQYVKSMNPWATVQILPPLLHEIKTAGKWQVKTGSLAALNQLVVSAPVQTARAMPDIVPVLAEAIWDTKADVKKAAREALTKATALVSNKDIERFIPALISALINPVEEVPSTIALLSATTFVSEVDAPTLSLMVPLLSRGLTEKLTAIKRKVAV